MPKPTTKENAFVTMMKAFAGEYDTLYIEAFDEDCIAVAGCPMNSDTFYCRIGATMISSFEEAVTAGYPIVTDGTDIKLEVKITKYFKTNLD